MSTINQPVQMIPIDAITVLNPRVRNRKIFHELVSSIASVGLKVPITVSRRMRANRPAYDLVCGQGRLEAFQHLGQTEIPAIVIEASPQDCYIMSLVENLARRTHSPLELLREIGVLRKRYKPQQIAEKIGMSEEYVYAVSYLLEHGEERLLIAVDRGQIPPSIAGEIARAKEGEVQAALAEAYEKGSLPGNQFMAIRRIIDERNARGKSMLGQRLPGKQVRRVTAESLVRSYKKETERQKLMIKKAALTQSRLTFVVNALRRLLGDDGFVDLLRREGMQSLPRPLAGRLGMGG